MIQKPKLDKKEKHLSLQPKKFRVQKSVGKSILYGFANLDKKLPNKLRKAC